VQVLVNILREMAIKSGGVGSFDYKDFTTRLDDSDFTAMQAGPLNMRLDLLESYVDIPPRFPATEGKDKKKKKKNKKNDKGKEVQNNNQSPKPSTWTPRQRANQPDSLVGVPGSLTIIDLTDPVVDPDSACVLFDICLSIFLSQTRCGKIVALDEAHNYMAESNAAAAQFTESLLKTIREQRHQGARVVIATQEPSINPRLLDLCNITMAHRFSSPAWHSVLKGHIAALRGDDGQEVFEEIVRLETGECLLFCPTAATGVQAAGTEVHEDRIVRMDTNYFKFRTRSRITADGGRSKTADGL
jgi:hypothetical protein